MLNTVQCFRRLPPPPISTIFKDPKRIHSVATHQSRTSKFLLKWAKETV